MNKHLKIYLSISAILFSSSFIYFSFQEIVRIKNKRKNIYNVGLSEYKNGECQQSIETFSSLSNNHSWFNYIDRLSKNSEQKELECSNWIYTINNADKSFNRNEYDRSLLEYNEFINKNPESELIRFSKNEIFNLFSNFGATQLATFSSCNSIESFKKNNIIPNQDNNLPNFYIGCINTYKERQYNNNEFNIQFSFLTEYPDHERAYNVKSSLIANPIVCNSTQKLQSNEEIANIESLMPAIYFNCGLSHSKILEYRKSIGFYKNLMYHYPNHVLSGYSEENLSTIDNNIAAIKNEMLEAVQVIDTRMKLCAAGGFLFDWVIDLGEAISGKDCMTDQPLSDIGRLITLIPVLDGVKGVKKAGTALKIIETVQNFNSLNQTKNLLDEDFFTFFENPENLNLLSSHNAKLKPLLASSKKRLDLSENHSIFVKFIN